MSDEEKFLSRWSRRKTESKEAPSPAAPSPAPVAAPAVLPPLPPVESLDADSDFTPFLREGVEEHLKRAALKTLFQDPRFNVMDGLDVYIDDYSKPDPLPEGWLEKLNQVARLGEYREPEPETEPKSEKEGEGDASSANASRDDFIATESDTSVPPQSAPPVSES